MSTEIHVRPFSGNGTRFDYQSLATLYRRIWPRMSVDPRTLRTLDDERQSLGPALRQIAEARGQPVGLAELHCSPFFAEPGHFVVRLGAVPGYRGVRTFARLDRAVEEAAAPYRPTRFIHYMTDADLATQEDAAASGYVEFQRETEYVARLAEFVPAPELLAKLTRPQEHGIEIVSVREMAGDPLRDYRIWALDSELFQQIPGEQGRRPEFEPWRQHVLHRDDFLDEGSFVAVDRATGEYVGLTILLGEREPGGHATIELTGVRTTHRRMGLATALKLRGMVWAQATGLARLHTFNDASNEPIRHLNESLGFQAKRDWVSMHRLLSVPAAMAEAVCA